MQVYLTRAHRRVDMGRMERLLSSASLIVMNTPEASKALKDTFPSLRRKEVITITNGFDDEDFAGLITPRRDNKFRIVHSGYLHTDSGLQLQKRRYYRLLGGMEPGVDISTRSHTVLLEAIARWRSERPEVGQHVELVFAGQTSKEDRAFANRCGVASLVQFTGYVSHQESIQLVRTADLLFLPMHNLPVGKRSRIVPGKTYEYMASGRPILAAVPDGDARDYLRSSGTALICRPDDVSGMIRVLDSAYTAWKSGKNVATRENDSIAQFERRNLTHALARAFESVIERDPRSNNQVHANSGETLRV
jgi:glycosyltransferase involved in cell wall biosynthesis